MLLSSTLINKFLLSDFFNNAFYQIGTQETMRKGQNEKKVDVLM